MEKGATWFRAILAANGLSIDDSQCDVLDRYCTLLLDWNRKINLISRRSEDTIWEEQILQSISFLTRIKLKASASVIDIGTGGGLPGIPLKILMPGLSLTLVDSIGKKINAVQSIIQSLGISGIEAVWSRAEDFNGNRNEKEKKFFDYVICRGVGQLEDLWEYGYPLLLNISSIQGKMLMKSQAQSAARIFIEPGVILALKGGDIQEEIVKLERRKKKIAITVIDVSLRIIGKLENNKKKIIIMRPVK
ncbi:MAG: 16S rRNA (guanine(527)-N(7))-methyltransferase RsmG [Bacteroidota bacterium]